MLRYSYGSTELRREITTWEELTICFAHTFNLSDANPDVHNALQLIHNVFLKVVSVAYLVDPHVHFQMQSMIECCNVAEGPEDDDDP